MVGGFLKGNKLPLGDGVDGNDKPFRADVPVRRAAASPGFDGADASGPSPPHEPTPAQP